MWRSFWCFTTAFPCAVFKDGAVRPVFFHVQHKGYGLLNLLWREERCQDDRQDERQCYVCQLANLQRITIQWWLETIILSCKTFELQLTKEVNLSCFGVHSWLVSPYYKSVLFYHANQPNKLDFMNLFQPNGKIKCKPWANGICYVGEGREIRNGRSISSL